MAGVKQTLDHLKQKIIILKQECLKKKINHMSEFVYLSFIFA